MPTPVRLFQACPDTTPSLPPLSNQSYGYTFDTPDGQKFLVNSRARAVTAGPYVVLLNDLGSPR
jgi:hypothetical protein